MSGFLVLGNQVPLNVAVFYTFHHQLNSVYSPRAAGFVNFSNRISSLLFVTLALTSSSRRDKYALWMLSWQSEPLTDRNEWVPRFPCRSPCNLGLDKCGKCLQRTEENSSRWGSRSSSVVLLLNVHVVLKERRADKLPQTGCFLRPDIGDTRVTLCVLLFQDLL